MVVSLFLMPRALLLTSHCVGLFQWPTVPSAGWLLDASTHVFCITVEQPRSISLHRNSKQGICLFQRNYFFISLLIPYLGTQQATDRSICSVHLGIL
jgi:hypothetical protein